VSELQFDSDRLVRQLSGTTLAPWAKALASSVLNQGHALKHGHLPQWEAAVDALPASAPIELNVEQGLVRINGEFDEHASEQLSSALKGLMPWRKGPFQFGPIFIDTEWRSDWKWDRIESHIAPLDGRSVLDVGCGSGYHLWRMRDAGAALCLGIDPSLLYLKQFDAVQHYVQDDSVHLLPLGMESLPDNMQVFDTVFSMGVLYHRREPSSHLEELRRALIPGGELVLETLVIPGDDIHSLLPDSRYANMRNIYELPTVARLEQWVAEAGFESVRTVSVDTTSRSEQRSTDWMTSHSLSEALDARDPSLTVEGHPRPLRAVVLANKKPNA